MSVFRTQLYPGSNKRVIFLLPGWRSKIWMFWIFAKIIEINGYFCLLYEYNDTVLSPDTKKTVTDLTLIRDDVLNRIKNLRRVGYNDFSIFGTSLGSVIALMVADKSPEVKRIILNLVGFDIAETIWSWDKIYHYFKKDLLKQGYDLKRLQADWRKISPRNYINNLTNKKLLIYLTEKDDVIPIDLGMKLVKEIQNKNYQYKLIVNSRLRHLSAGAYNLINVNSYLTFLKN